MSSIFPHNHQINIIENILDELNIRVRRTVAIPETLNQLRAKILLKTTSLKNYVQRFVTSMRRRWLVVVKSVGDIPADIDAAAGFDLRIL